MPIEEHGAPNSPGAEAVVKGTHALVDLCDHLRFGVPAAGHVLCGLQERAFRHAWRQADLELGDIQLGLVFRQDDRIDPQTKQPAGAERRGRMQGACADIQVPPRAIWDRKVQPEDRCIAGGHTVSSPVFCEIWHLQRRLW